MSCIGIQACPRCESKRRLLTFWQADLVRDSGEFDMRFTLAPRTHTLGANERLVAVNQQPVVVDEVGLPIT